MALRRRDLNAFRERALTRGVNPFLYWPIRAILVPVFVLYFRMQRLGREHLPSRGPLRFPIPERASPALAAAVTERIWACVSLQWEWLGGVSPRREGPARTSATPARRRRAPETSSAREEAHAA